MRTWRWLLLLALTGCEGAAPAEQSGRVASGENAGVVAARVNGEPITVREVQRFCELSGLSPKEALARLVDERLLAQYAQERGYGDLRSARIEIERARVRSLLEQVVEPGTEPANIPSQEVLIRFDKVKAQNQASLEELEPAIRRQLSNEVRRKRLDTLLEELRSGTKIVYDEPAIEQALSEQGAAGTGT